ncbi:MAG TPA: CheR family methyltransferase, partial [Gammaproteobacteria bacterium]|nr:CheR family methyltransferase [Gammaproteobacteria bacterium]
MAEALSGVPADQQQALERLLRERTGIVLQSYQKENLAQILEAARQNFGYATVSDYLDALVRSTSTAQEMEYLIGRVTIGESYFFRDDEQLRFLREAWLPGIIREKAARGEKTLRVWSAGCSAGQEIYTIAMLLEELVPDPESWSFHLLGTDINTAGLSQAIRGQYTPWSLRSTPDEYRGRYFEKAADQYVIAPGLRGLVKFFYLNLLEDNFPTMLTGTNAMDLILCRNVFIYLDPELLPPVMEKFRASLVPGGVLLLGASDLAAEPVGGLDLQQWGNSFFFRRTDGLELQIPPPPPPQAEPEPAAPAPAPAEMVQEAPAAAPAPRGKYEDVIQLLREERWADVVEKVDEHLARDGVNAELTQHKAKALANLGALEEAAKTTQQSIDMAPLDKHTYLIKALVMLELNDLERAEEALKGAIFLDGNFVEAHFQLGLLQLRQG